MKGVSTVIATILMLMITIALAGTAYFYISGTFNTQIQGLGLDDGYCTGGTTTRIQIRNIGTNGITFVNGVCTTTGGTKGVCGTIVINRIDGGTTSSYNGNDAAIEPGTTAEITDTGCTVLGTPRSCVYRISPPNGRPVEAIVSCSG